MNTKKSAVSGSQLVPSVQDASFVMGLAKAIVDLCPVEGRCLLNKVYVEAMILLGKDWQDVLDASEEVLRQTCTHCHQPANQEHQTAA